MTSGSGELIKKLRDVVERGGKLDDDTRDVLLFSAIIDIYEQLDTLRPVLTFYKISLFVTSAIIVSGIAVLIGKF